jgi:hypothetical protein
MPGWKWFIFWLAVQIRWLPGELKGWLWRLITPAAKREGVCATTQLKPLELTAQPTPKIISPDGNAK